MFAALSAAGYAYNKSESQYFKPLSFNFLNSPVATCDAPELSEDQDERENQIIDHFYQSLRGENGSMEEVQKEDGNVVIYMYNGNFKELQ